MIAQNIAPRYIEESVLEDLLKRLFGAANYSIAVRNFFPNTVPHYRTIVYLQSPDAFRRVCDLRSTESYSGNIMEN